MVRSKFGLKALGLSVLMLSLMALTASAAQAEAGARWMINGADIDNGTGGVKLLASIGGEIENETGSLLATVLGIPLKVLCKVGTMEGTHLGASGSLTEGKIKFSNCATYLNGSATATAACLPKSAGENDIIKTNNFIGLLELILANTLKGILIKTPTGTGNLATIESSEECAVGQKLNITGTIALKECNNTLETELVKHLFSYDAEHSTLKVSGQTATLDVSVNIFLTGAHNGLKWSGLVK